MPQHLNLIARTNGVGLDRDVSLVKSAAEAAGYEVTISHCRDLKPWAGLLPQTKKYDANIFMERVFTRWLGTAETNILIPNQERFPERHLARLAKIDHVFCKSRHALEVFGKHHPSCHYTGFTSENLLDESISRKEDGVLHLAGRSTLKGTEEILNQWSKHPEWPKLTLLQHKENAPESVPRNVNLITDYVSDEDLRKLYNAHPIHLCTSLSEGWGHYIVEAMSCRAHVITTDAPPMNELIKEPRGSLVAWSKSEQRHLGTNFYITPDSLEAAIKNALSLDPAAHAEKGEAARQWMQHNDAAFRESLAEKLDELLKPQSAQK